MENLLLKPVGKIITPFKSMADCPQNSCFAQDDKSTIVVDGEYQEALLGIASASL